MCRWPDGLSLKPPALGGPRRAVSPATGSDRLFNHLSKCRCRFATHENSPIADPTFGAADLAPAGSLTKRRYGHAASPRSAGRQSSQVAACGTLSHRMEDGVARSDVLIIGAGPTGLVLALWL